MGQLEAKNMYYYKINIIKLSLLHNNIREEIADAYVYYLIPILNI